MTAEVHPSVACATLHNKIICKSEIVSHCEYFWLRIAVLQVDSSTRSHVAVNRQHVAVEVNAAELNISFNTCIVLQCQPSDTIIIGIFEADFVNVIFC